MNNWITSSGVSDKKKKPVEAVPEEAKATTYKTTNVKVKKAQKGVPKK
jgi:hypothetical protein